MDDDYPDLGRYQLLDHLHDGTVSDVYLARKWGDGGFQRPVAVKRLHVRHLGDSYALFDFQDEATLLGALSHSAFPQVYDLRIAGPSWVIAMEYVQGHRLDAVMRGGEGDHALPIGVALSIASQLCDGLSHAHELRSATGAQTPIIHCKVTPRNVLITSAGMVKLLDLGGAHSTIRRNERPEIHETVAYMAPEQIMGQKVDARADVFSLGALLFELTTGQLPYEGEDDLELTKAIVEKVAARPSSVMDGYPEPLGRIVERALARDLNDRYESAAELSRALDSFALQDGILISPKLVAAHVAATLGEPPPNPHLLDEPVPPPAVAAEADATDR